MADNYLEKRMEDYRAGRLAPKSRVVVHTAAAKRNPGDFVVEFPPMRILVIGGALPLVSALVKNFRKVDCQVALCHGDTRALTPLAQKEGCRYYPFDPTDEAKRSRVVDDLSERWGGVDVVIDLNAVTADCGDIAEERIADVATLLTLHSHPRFTFVGATEIEL